MPDDGQAKRHDRDEDGFAEKLTDKLAAFGAGNFADAISLARRKAVAGREADIIDRGDQKEKDRHGNKNTQRSDTSVGVYLIAKIGIQMNAAKRL